MRMAVKMAVRMAVRMAKMMGEMVIVCGLSVVVTLLAIAVEQVPSMSRKQIKETGVGRRQTQTVPKELVVRFVQANV